MKKPKNPRPTAASVDARLTKVANAADRRRYEFEVAVNGSIKMVCDRVDELTGHVKVYRDVVGRAEFESLRQSVAACETRAKDQEAAISELDKDVQVHARTLEDVESRIAALEQAGSRSRDEGVATPTEREASKGGNPAPVGSDPAPATPPAPRAFKIGDVVRLVESQKWHHLYGRDCVVTGTLPPKPGTTPMGFQTAIEGTVIIDAVERSFGSVHYWPSALTLVRAAPEAPPAAAPAVETWAPKVGDRVTNTACGCEGTLTDIASESMQMRVTKIGRNAGCRVGVELPAPRDIAKLLPAPEKPTEASPPREPDAALVEELAVFWRKHPGDFTGSARAVLAKLRELGWTPSSGALMSLRAEVDRLRAENRKLGEEIADMTKKRDYLLGEFTALKARRVRRTRAVTKEDAREFMEYPAGVRETCRALGFRRVVEEKGGGS